MGPSALKNPYRQILGKCCLNILKRSNWAADLELDANYRVRLCYQTILFNMSAPARESIYLGHLAALTIAVMIIFIFQRNKCTPVRTLTSVPEFS